MALNNLGMGFVFTAKDRASAVVGGLNRNMMGLAATGKKAGMGAAGGLIGIGAAAGVAALGVAGIGTAISLANIAGTLEKELAAVGAISQASADDMERLAATARKAGIETQFSPQEAVLGLRSLAVQGFNAAESATALTGALDLAAGGAIPVSDAAQTMASSLRVFGMDADQAGFAADKLLRITNRTALQANEMTLAIGNLGRGVGLTKQSMDEMLPSIGLVRNSGVEASVASSSVSSALMFMAKNAKRFKDVGVEVTDASGKFKPFMDIVLETKEALGEKFPNAAMRAKKAVAMFGRFGVTAFSAISSQTGKGIRDTEGNLLKGADAVNFLREAMAGAKGAAEEFKEALLDTFEGQKTLLRGSLETLAVELGQPFAKIFKPIVTVVIGLVNALIGVWSRLPAGVKTAIGAAMLFGSILLFVVGSATALTLIFMLLAPFLLIMAKVALIAAGAMLALGLVFVGVAALAVAAWMAIKNNWGGMGDWFENLKEKVATVWEGLQQVLSGEGLSFTTEVMLRNMGLLGFVQAVGHIVQVAKQFWAGLVMGWQRGVEALAPTFKQLTTAFDEFMAVIGEVTIMFAESGAGMDGMKARGAGLGGLLATLVGWLAETLRWTLMVASGFIKAGLWIKEVFGVAVTSVSWSLQQLWNLLKNVGEALQWVMTMGQAGGDFEWGPGLADMLDADANEIAKRRAEIGKVGMGGPAVSGTQYYPSESYVGGTTGAGGVAAITRSDIENGTAAGMSRALAGTPIRLEGDANGEAMFNMLSNIQQNQRNRGGLPTPPGFDE